MDIYYKYEEICQQNKLLFERHEELTTEISFLKLRGCDVSEQNDELLMIKNLKFGNLEILDEILNGKQQEVRPAKRRFDNLVLTKKEQNVINVYLDNPEASMRTVAALSVVKIDAAHRIISNYLQNNIPQKIDKVIIDNAH